MECVICLGRLSDCEEGEGTSKGYRLACGHDTFHESCLKDWWRHRRFALKGDDSVPLCPLCKAEVPAGKARVPCACFAEVLVGLGLALFAILTVVLVARALGRGDGPTAAA